MITASSSLGGPSIGRLPRPPRASERTPAARRRRSRERVYLPAFAHRDLADDVRRRTETVEANRAAHLPDGSDRYPMSPAQRRGAACVDRVALGDGKQKLSSATVNSAKPPSTSYPVKRALSQGSRPERQYRQTPQVQPSHGTPRVARERTEPAAADHLADDLVSEDERQLRVLKLAVEDVEVGTTDAAGSHSKENLSGRGRWFRTSRSTSLVRGASRIMALTTPPSFQVEHRRARRAGQVRRGKR